MTKVNLLKRLNRALSSEKVDFSGFDNELNVLKKKLTETVNIQTVDDVGRKLKQFQSKIDFTPLLNEVEKIRTLFSEKTKELEKSISEKNEDRVRMNELRNSKRADLIGEEIGALTEVLDSVKDNQKAALESLNKTLDEIKVTHRLFQSGLAKVSEDLKKYDSREESEKVLNEALDKLRIELNNRINNNRLGGAINRQMFIGGVDPLTRYTDMNLKAGSNVTITYANNNTTKKVDVTISATGGSGSGIVRSVNSISSDTTADSAATTDYVYLVSGTTTLTLPTAVGNSNLYTVKNVGVGTVTITPAGAETIDGAANVVMPVRYTSVDLISDTLVWSVT